MALKIYLYTLIESVLLTTKTSLIYIKNASLRNSRDAFIMIYIFNYGQQQLNFYLLSLLKC